MIVFKSLLLFEDPIGSSLQLQKKMLENENTSINKKEADLKHTFLNKCLETARDIFFMAHPFLII